MRVSRKRAFGIHHHSRVGVIGTFELMPRQDVYLSLKSKLERVVPDFELREKAAVAEEILRLKREINAVILGHNYMEPALFHSVPDFAGDSLYLCRKAAETKAETIVFCGVRFMAETAKILNPEKRVLIPSPKAGCSLAESLDAEQLRRIKERHPGTPVVAYVNTPAEVKAEADACCTSGNAVAVVGGIGAQEVIFVPDEYLAQNTAAELGWDVTTLTDAEMTAPPRLSSRRRIIAWRGRCEVHEKFTVEDVENVRRQFPDVVVLAHPECPPEVSAVSDFTGSTAQMIRRIDQVGDEPVLLLTECAMADNIIAAGPSSNILRLCSLRCPHMAEINLEDTLASLRRGRYEVDVPEPVRTRARAALETMVAVG